MKRTISVLMSTVVLAGCAASPQSRAMLDAANRDCLAGNPDACAAVPAQRAQVQAEEQANTTALAVGLGALAIVGGVAAAAAGSDDDRHHRRYYRRY